MSIKVSFAVAVYNVAKYIERCARSLFEQTLNDIEIVFINDGTPDDSVEIIKRVLEEYPRRKDQVRIVTHETNKGLPETRKDCYLCPTGEYVIALDGDDYVEPQMAESMYNKAIATDADMVVCEFLAYDARGSRILTVVPNGIIGDGQNVRDDMINRIVSPGVWCRMVKATLFKENDFVWAAENFGEDIVLSTQIAYYAKRIASVDVPLYHYCYNQDSICNTRTEANILNKYYGFKANFDIVIKFLEDKGVAEKYEDGIFRNKVWAKTMLNSLLDQRKYRKLWVKTYPEVNRSFLFGDKYRKPSYRERFWFLALSMGLYPKYKKRIYSKRFKPRAEWLPAVI